MLVECPQCRSANSPDSDFCAKCGARLGAQDEATLSKTLTTPPHLEEIIAGTVLREKYRIIETIGRGGMGIVYKAEDLRLKRIVALKFLSPSLTGEWEARERFVREAQAASELDHPNICTIYEFDQTEAGQGYIAMAYYPGESLKSRIKREPLEIRETLEIAIQMARGLEKAHQRGIVHRDIKPTNVLITEDGLVKILDFGLAKLSGTTQVTRAGTTMGTVAYMSPEQATGDEVDQRTDLWSLGVVLYEMLSGELPFKGERDASTLYSIVHEEPKRLRALRPDTPSELGRIVDRALAKKPQLRYASAGEMLKDLQEYQESLRISEAAPFNPKSLLRLMRKPLVAIPTLLVLLAIGLLGWWFLNRQARIRSAREQLLPEIDRLVEAGWENYVAAYKLAVEAEKILPQDPKLAAFFTKIAAKISFETEPPGAKIYIREYRAPESEWKYLGVSPLDKVRLPLGLFAWKMEKEGYETALAASPTFSGHLDVIWTPIEIFRILDKKGTIPAGMVRVQGIFNRRQWSWIIST